VKATAKFAAVKEKATGINRLSKLPGCSDVVISVWNGHKISEQVTFDCSKVCAVYIQHLRNISVSRFDKALCALFFRGCMSCFERCFICSFRMVWKLVCLKIKVWELFIDFQ
jgi:hypothetical protein